MTMPAVGTWTIGSGGAFGLLTPAEVVAAAAVVAAATVAAAEATGVPGGGEALALPTEPGSLKPWVLLFSSGPSKKLRLNSLPASNDTSGVRVSGAGALPKPALSDWSSLKTSIVRASNVRTGDHGVGGAGGEQRGARRVCWRYHRLRHSAFGARLHDPCLDDGPASRITWRFECRGRGTFAVFAERNVVTLLSQIFKNPGYPGIWTMSIFGHDYPANPPMSFLDDFCTDRKVKKKKTLPLRKITCLDNRDRYRIFLMITRWRSFSLIRSFNYSTLDVPWNSFI